MFKRSAGARLSTALVCPSKESQGPASRSAKAGPRRLEQMSDVILEVIFSAGQPNVRGGDPALPVDQKRGGQRIHSAVLISHHVVSQNDPVVHFELLDVRLHR